MGGGGGVSEYFLGVGSVEVGEGLGVICWSILLSGGGCMRLDWGGGVPCGGFHGILGAARESCSMNT